MSKPSQEELQSAWNTVNTIRTFNGIRTKMTGRKVHQANEISEEKLKGAVSIEKVKFPESGGTFTYYSGLEYPMKGFFDKETVDKVADLKIDIMVALLFFKKVLKRKLLGPIFLLLFRKQIKESFNTWVSVNHTMLKDFLIDEIRYCDFVQEVRRVFPGDHKTEDLLGMILEFDDAYRYRFQDAFGQFDQVNFNKHPIKELKKFFKYLEDNENILKKGDKWGENLKSKWRMVGLIIPFIVFDRKLFKMVKKFFNELNVEKLKLSPEDRFHSKKKFGYNWND